jgi:hypothetical protein
MDHPPPTSIEQKSTILRLLIKTPTSRGLNVHLLDFKLRFQTGPVLTKSVFFNIITTELGMGVGPLSGNLYSHHIQRALSHHLSTLISKFILLTFWWATVSSPTL